MKPEVYRRVVHGLVCLGLMSVATLFAGLAGVVGLLLFWSYPGRPRSFVDDTGTPLPRCLSEKIFNGVKQGMIIESKDTANPVLLYLHGGMPEYFLSRRFPTGMEALFTVVWWEQRGCGLSCGGDIPKASITAKQLIADTLAVTDYVRRRFGQEKIYLMAHSGGTFFGIQAAAQAPERFQAYIGVAQMSHQLESEQLAHDYMLDQFRKMADVDMVRKLEAAPVTLQTGTPPAYLAVRDEAMHRLGVGTMHNMTSLMQGIVFASLKTREYTLGEKVNLWRGKLATRVSALWDEAITTNLCETISSVDLPVYFFHGRFDYTVSYPLAKAYLERLQAPVKRFYTFDHSAHSPMFEEPDETLRMLRKDVLQ
jgi:pimeloyl-ACP methyl ester carboxylesterase